jgi:hypothetical protein
VRVDEFFFQNYTLPVSYPCPSRVHGYHGHGYYEYGYEGTRARVDEYVYRYGIFFLLFLFLLFFTAGSAGTGAGFDLM